MTKKYCDPFQRYFLFQIFSLQNNKEFYSAKILINHKSQLWNDQFTVDTHILFVGNMMLNLYMHFKYIKPCKYFYSSRPDN